MRLPALTGPVRDVCGVTVGMECLTIYSPSDALNNDDMVSFYSSDISSMLEFTPYSTI